MKLGDLMLVMRQNCRTEVDTEGGPSEDKLLVPGWLCGKSAADAMNKQGENAQLWGSNWTSGVEAV
jgi:hypothetical protein